jgi:hypothetical protein
MVPGRQYLAAQMGSDCEARQVSRSGLRLLAGSRARIRLPNRGRGRGIAPKLPEKITVINSQVIIALLFTNEECSTLVYVEFELRPDYKVSRKLKRRSHVSSIRCASLFGIDPYFALCCVIKQEFLSELLAADANIGSEFNFVVIIAETGKLLEKPGSDSGLDSPV